MIEKIESNNDLMLCLKDCGIKDEMFEQYKIYHENNSTKDKMKLLSRQRRLLMDHIHEYQRKVDCVDYVIRKLEKESNKFKDS